MISSPKQNKSFLEATHRYNIWVGSIRAGKTFSSTRRFIHDLQFGPPGDAMIVGVNRATMDFTLYINPEEWFKMADEIKLSTLRHEAMHLTMFHLITMDRYPNSKMDNIACD